MDTSVAAKQPQWLEKPMRISEHKWLAGTQPVVSIFCITYNHEKYIRDAIEGFLMQETTFPVEIFIHDDASQDKTPLVVKEYKEKYPRLFRLVLQKENQWSKHGNAHLFELVASLNADFIAFCEGDDFWTSKNKLEQQTELLMRSPRISGSYHKVNVIEDGKTKNVYPPDEKLKELSLAGILEENVASTCGLFLRKASVKKNMNWALGLKMGDWPLIAEAVFDGPIIPISGIHAHYRLHSQSVWMGKKELYRLIETERFYQKAFRRFKNKITFKNLEKRKNNLERIWKSAYLERKASIALFALVKYFFLGPKRFTAPKKQKRIILFAATFGILGKQ